MKWFKNYIKYSDEELMLALQKGESEAFNEVYKRYSKRLLHFMYKILGSNEPKAQDLLQDLFLLLVEHPNKFDASRKFQPWVFTVAANLCRKQFRGPQIKELSPAEFELKTTDELIAPLDGKIFRKHLRTQLSALGYEHRTTFLLRYQEEFPLKEIAAIMDCSLGTVKSRIYYTNKKLAEELEAFKPLYIKE